MSNRKVFYPQEEDVFHANKIRKIAATADVIVPQIAIGQDTKVYSTGMEVILVNGSWDTSNNKLPNLIAEMHNVKTEEYQIHHNKQRPVDTQNSSTNSADSGIEADCTEGNLSWLLNYKIHELPPVPDANLTAENYIVKEETYQNVDLYQDVPRIPENIKAVEEPILNTNNSYRCSGPKKPPFTYTELIEHALNEKGELTVSGIYRWISEHFPFYKQNDDRWKNSVRHNLSINPHFRKGGKAVHGAGHLWTIAQKDDKKALQIKQRVQQFIQSSYKETRSIEQDEFDQELQAATESILNETFNDDERQDRKRGNIEIEYVNLIDVPNTLEDFLSPPVSKQEIVQECGLGSDFFITDINPNTLGLNLTANTEETIYDEINLEYYNS